jgi:hypothetical protein
MPTHKTIQIAFLVAAILFELILVFASTFYMAWDSSGFLLVTVSAGASCAAIILCIVLFDQHTDGPL